MPLNSDAKISRRVLDRFDDPVRGACHHPQFRARQGDGLMVQAVDLGLAGPQQRCQARILFDRKLVTPLCRVELVIPSIGQVVGEVVVQGTTELERQQLCAITDPQDRNPPLEGGNEQLAVEGDLKIARGIELHAFGIGSLGQEIVSARQ